jgi:flagellar FliJ protein
MKKSQRLKTIVDLKAAQTKTALESMGACQRRRVAMENQITGLKNYRLDYQSKLDKLGGGGANIAQLLEFKSFIEKLDKAIAGQEQALLAIEQELQFKKNAWESLHFRTQGLQKVCDKALVVEAKHEDKAEQQAMDERASRLGRNGRLA